ncbi:hypothetical protein MRX96_044108 [Rhipicephalus microplus]
MCESLAAVSDPYRPSKKIPHLQAGFRVVASEEDAGAAVIYRQPRFGRLPHFSDELGGRSILSWLVPSVWSMFRAEMNKRWDLQWSLENSDTELHNWVPDLRQLPSFFPPNKALVTLLTGHGRFHPYFHRFNQMGEPRCFCGGMCENIKHHLMKCPDARYIAAELSPQVMADDSNLPRILEWARNRVLLIRLVRHIISEDIPELSRGRWVRAWVSVRVTKRTVAHDIHTQSNT